MCGIVGFNGLKSDHTIQIITKALRDLDYRGYDSAGIGVINDAGKIQTIKVVGDVNTLNSIIHQSEATKKKLTGCLGMGHTRWATTGQPSIVNAHPHVSYDNSFMVVHNGIIENHEDIRCYLASVSIKQRGETDSELISHYLAHKYNPLNPLEGIKLALGDLKGSFALLIATTNLPGMLIGVSVKSPLIFGFGGDYCVFSSSNTALHSNAEIIQLTDGDIVIGMAGTYYCDKLPSKLPLVMPEPKQEEPEPTDSYMLKEIKEQPSTLWRSIQPRIDLDMGTIKFGIDNNYFHQMRRLILTGCGTSYHAGLVGEYLIEELARVPVEVEYASEFRYRNAPIDHNTVVIAITQSGETADTLAAVRESKRRGFKTLGICNVSDSSIARETSAFIAIDAGPEIGVASTKAFVNQVAVLALLALHLGRLNHITLSRGQEVVNDLIYLPDLVGEALKCSRVVVEMVEKFKSISSCLYLGRDILYPIALEGALKLKEVSYIHATAIPAAEIKHGPIALIDKNTPTIVVMPSPSDPMHVKMLNAIEEVKARQGPVLAIACVGDQRTSEVADDIIYVPQVSQRLQPIVSVVPLQLFAYHMAVARGCNVDKPRNLAKSVTVE